MASIEGDIGRERKVIGIVLYEGFETLDVFGPVQMWGRLPEHDLVLVSQTGGAVTSAQGQSVAVSFSFEDAPRFDVLMVPGGIGSRREVGNADLLDFLQRQSGAADWTTSVCTGAALLARAGLLDGRRATTNKEAYGWATGQSSEVLWQPRARWVIDGRFATSSGVSAGTDMALALVQELYGRNVAERIARHAEYRWNDDPDDDPFAVAAPDGPKS